MYGDEWVMPRQETQQKVVEYAQRAHAGGAADALTLSIAGAYSLHNALGQPAEAFAAFQKAARTAPGYHYPHQLLLPQYLEKNDAESARESAAIIIGFDPTNPTALQITMSLYARAQALDEFVTAAGEIADEYVEDPEARGNILFHKASGHSQIGQVAEGRRTIQEAWELFSKVYDATHPVFAEIERVLADTE
jgi:tetratricopeptide (TPR) repeat protein